MLFLLHFYTQVLPSHKFIVQRLCRSQRNRELCDLLLQLLFYARCRDDTSYSLEIPSGTMDIFAYEQSHLSLFPISLHFNGSLNIGDFLLLIADILMIVAVIWTILSGVEYVRGALPFLQENQDTAVSKA